LHLENALCKPNVKMQVVSHFDKSGAGQIHISGYQTGQGILNKDSTVWLDGTLLALPLPENEFNQVRIW
jgi:hypothetical protein